MTLLNILDLLLVLFCSITLILVFTNPCSSGTRSEEVLDTVLLVIRNGVQFLRLGNILRRWVPLIDSVWHAIESHARATSDLYNRSGHSLLSPPKPIDLSQARTASLALDLDLDLDDEEAVAERHLQGGRRTLVRGQARYEPLFTDEEGSDDRGQAETRRPLDVKNNAGQGTLAPVDEEIWDRL
jgi:hypothetical protein